MDTCELRHVPYHYCDVCGYDEDIYELDGEELCVTCLLDKLKKIQ